MPWRTSKRSAINFGAAVLLSVSMVVGLSSPVTASPVTATVEAGLISGNRDMVSAGSKIYVLNGDNIKVVDTSGGALSSSSVSTITFSEPALDGALQRAVYIPSDQSLWVTSYALGATTGTGLPAGEVIRIDTTTNQVTHRFCARHTGTNCTPTAYLEGAVGITASSEKVYVAMQAYHLSRDGVAVFDIAGKSRETNLAYTAAGGSTDAPAYLGISGDYLYIFQAAGYFHIVPYKISGDDLGQKTPITNPTNPIYVEFATTGPDGNVYYGRPSWIRKISPAGAFSTVYSGAVAGIVDIAFSGPSHSDGDWIFRTQTGDTSHGVMALDRAAPHQIDGSVGSLAIQPTGIAVDASGNYLYLATPPTITQVSLNPTVSTTSASLTLDVSGTIAAPTISGFWKTVAYTSTALPSGLTLDSATGVISGIPTVAGTTNVTVTATNSTMFTRSSNFSITVVDPDAPPPSPPASGGVAVSKPAVPELAATGSNANGLGQLSLVAIIAGAVVALVARRLALRDSAQSGA